VKIKEDLKLFYDREATKYASTRNKHRSDADIILNQIRNYWKKTISILEFWCGAWRLLDKLSDLKWIKINYIWIDISKELLKIAKNNTKILSSKNQLNSFTFKHEDITEYIKLNKQESFDFIIGTASFQHIPTLKERFFLIKNFYRLLKYEWQLIMTNRAPSQRFLLKYKKQILQSLYKFILSFGKHNIRDIQVPRKSNKQIFYRYYHLFSLKELESITKAWWFIINKLTYLNKDSKELWNKRKHASNSLLIATKKIFN